MSRKKIECWKQRSFMMERAKNVVNPKGVLKFKQAAFGEQDKT